MPLRPYRSAGLGLLLAGLCALPVPAQPTAAGTVITNTIAANWSDANANTYVAGTASVSATVGQAAGVDLSSPATVTPTSPSTGNELAFTVTNTGNATDQFQVTVKAEAGVTVTGYRLGSTTYATLAELNTALSGTNVPAGNVVAITVFYTVAPGQGGQTIPLPLSAESLADSNATDSATTNVVPAVSAFVSVTPENGSTSRLPSNGTQYTATFTIENAGNASDTFTLAAGTNDGAVLTVVSTNGTAGTDGSVTLAPGASTTADVVYTVDDAVAGATADLTLTATSGNDGTVSDPGSYTVTVVRAAVSATKEVFRNDQTTAISFTDRVTPGEFIWYRITLTNTGAAAASKVSVSDPLPAQVTYDQATGDAAGWTISESSGTVTASLSGLLVPSASRSFWIRVRVN